MICCKGRGSFIMENENESLLLCAINPSNGCLAWGSGPLMGSVQRAAKATDRAEDRMRSGRPEPGIDREGECHRCFYIIF